MDETLFNNSFGIEGELKPTNYLIVCGCLEPYIYQTVCKYALDYVLTNLSGFQQVAPNIFVTCDSEQFSKVQTFLNEYYNLTEGQCRPV